MVLTVAALTSGGTVTGVIAHSADVKRLGHAGGSKRGSVEHKGSQLGRKAR